MPTEDVPSIRVQFSADQLLPIFIGLDDLAQEATHVRATGSLRHDPDLPDEYGRYGQREAPSDEQMSALESAHAKIQPRLETGGWVRIDHRELAACALAVSHAKRLIRKNHADPWRADYKDAARRLHALIEKHRKRAIKQLPTSLQKEERRKILSDLRAVRRRLAPNVHNRKQKPWERRRSCEFVDKAERLALAGLRQLGFEAPANRASVRLLVRAYLRNVARRGFGRQMCLEDEFSAALMLADYVTKHADNLVRRTTHNDESERRIHATKMSPSDVSSTPRGEVGTSLPAALRKEVPVAVRIACSELEWLMMEDFDGQSAWSKMSRFDRVVAVKNAKDAGLSNRHIGRIIGLDDKTVGRMLKEARFPMDVRTQIARGNKSGNQALREASDPVYQQSKRLDREKADGSMSDAHAKQVIAFIGAHGVFARQIVARAKELATRVPLLQLLRLVPHADVDKAMAASRNVRVNADRDDPGIDTVANQLCWWLLRVAPERALHIAALDKALGSLPNRARYGTTS